VTGALGALHHRRPGEGAGRPRLPGLRAGAVVSGLTPALLLGAGALALAGRGRAARKRV
jgi:hypothetical protein